jgi:hypothetical protein
MKTFLTPSAFCPLPYFLDRRDAYWLVKVSVVGESPGYIPLSYLNELE